jgi:hypothetical protein
MRQELPNQTRQQTMEKDSLHDEHDPAQAAYCFHQVLSRLSMGCEQAMPD